MDTVENNLSPCTDSPFSELGNRLYQVVGFKWKKSWSDLSVSGRHDSSRKSNTWQPWLLLANGNDAEEPVRLALWGRKISIKLGNKKCVGYFSGGKHFRCPDSADAGVSSACPACKQRDDWFGCIQCTGEIAAAEKSKEGSCDTNSSARAECDAPRYDIACKNPKQREGCMRNKYWIYLAAFDGLLKVGCSYEQRFFERMIEQGADFGCRLGIVMDGGYARALEQKIAKHLGLPDKIHGAVKQAKLFGEPNRSVIEIAKAIARVSDSGLIDTKPETFDFRRYYRLDNVHIRPRSVQLMPGVRLVGDVIATKGNIIIMKTAAGVISFDAHRLVGYEAEFFKHPKDQIGFKILRHN